MKRIELKHCFNTTPQWLWEMIVDVDHYRYWTTAFSQGSTFIGDWSQGSRIRFVMDDETGNVSGMISEVVLNGWPNAISIKHVGLVMNGVEDTESEEALFWTPAYENYTFEQEGLDQCWFIMTQDIPESVETEFIENWKHAFELIEQRLKSVELSTHPITIQSTSTYTPEQLWDRLTQSDLVKTWNHASEDWHCPKAENDLRIGGEFHYEMAAKDGSMSFDFWGIYTLIDINRSLHFILGDHRNVSIEIVKKPYGCLVIERFEPEQENDVHLQRLGWQAILNNLTKVE